MSPGNVQKSRRRLICPKNFPPPGCRQNIIAGSIAAARMLLLAAHEAWTQSGWQPGENIPIVLGTTSGEMSLGQDYLRQAIQSPQQFRGQATRVTYYQVQRQALDLCEAFGFHGPITIISNACASGANAIVHAWELLRDGRAERV